MSTKNSQGSETDARPVEGTEPIPFWPTVWTYMRPYRGKVALAAVTSMLVGIAVALQPILIKFIVDDGINRDGPPGERLRYAAVFTGLFLFASVFRMTVWRVGYRRMVQAIEGSLVTLRTDFFRHVQFLCFRFHDQVPSGELFNYLFGTPLVSIKTFLGQAAMSVPYQIVSCVIVMATLWTFNWLMSLITLAMVVLMVLVHRRSRRVIRERSADFLQTESSVSKYVEDMLRGARAIKVYVMEDSVTASLESRLGVMRVKSQDLAMRQNLEVIKYEGIHYGGTGIIYLAGAYLCIRGDLDVGEFFAFVASVTLLAGSLMMFLQLGLVKANAEAGLDRIERIRRVQPTTRELPAVRRVSVVEEARTARERHAPAIQMRDVCFAYSDRPIFDGLSCRIEDGRSVALVGPSGGGKSTFVNLLLRFYDPQSGQVLLNGQDLRSYSLRDLRAGFGVVPQDPFLFQTSIFENIHVVRPESDEAEVRRAMDMAYVSEFVDAMPDGWHTPVGEGGANLSGGQKQRIAIARAILANPLYYIFDEATSALDNESERRIQQALRLVMRDHTTLVIAHRLTTIRHVDRILVFEDGRIVQDGTYEELLRQPGLFRRLATAAEEFGDAN